MQIPGGKKTKTGYSTAADVLEKLSADYPIVRDILEYRGLTKLKSTYADGLAAFIEEDGRIHTNFNQTITATGRISSTEPNLQNIPMRMELGRQIRKVFIPREGYEFMDADYSQIELRVLAHMSGDEKLIEAYKTVNPNATLELQTTDSTTGVSGALDGTYTIGMASRELKDSEVEGGAKATVLAKDGIAVIVSNDNPTENLTVDQIKGIYTGELTTWADVQ